MRPNTWPNAVLTPPPLPSADERWALFIDIDGTLVDFREHPDQVSLDAGTLTLLARIAGLLDGAMAVLSGRALADVDRVLSPLRLPAGAMHGLQWRDPAGNLLLADPPAAMAARVSDACNEAVRGLPGVWLEDKGGIAFAFHYRSAPAQEAAVLARAKSIAETSEGRFLLQRGDCVAELRPVGADKGDALASMMAAPAFRARRPVVLGDDYTDEAAFGAALAHGGFGVIVGPRRPTAAGHALASPLQVIQWLGALSRQLARRVSS